MNHREIVNFLWSVAYLIRDTFKRGKYQDIILPLAVLRRLDCVLAPTKHKDGRVGVVGYEINFNPYFYRDPALRPLKAIEADIRTFKQDIVRMSAEVTVGRLGGCW